MTLILDLPPELETKLSKAAHERGLDVADYAVRILQSGVIEDAPTAGRAILDQWEVEGVLGSWSGRSDIEDSASFSRSLRTQAESRSGF